MWRWDVVVHRSQLMLTSSHPIQRALLGRRKRSYLLCDGWGRDLQVTGNVVSIDLVAPPRDRCLTHIKFALEICGIHLNKAAKYICRLPKLLPAKHGRALLGRRN